MLFHTVISFFGMVSFVSSAALHPARQNQSVQPNPIQQQACAAAVTIQNYVTVTVTTTDFPDIVTVANPDYSSISKSLASASTIDSIVVVENSQNRPVNAPPNTVIPTFIHSINAPAVELTEAPHLGSSVFYLPGTRSPSTIVIGKTTESIILSSFGAPKTVPTAGPSPGQNFTIPAGGWNGTQANATDISPESGTGLTAGRNPTSTVTNITYVSTTTFVANTTLTTGVPYQSSLSSNSSGYGGYGDKAKRQTCVLVSANFNGHWGSWCNNYGWSTTYTYSSWETTITPGVSQGVGSAATSIASGSSTSSNSVTVTVAASSSPAVITVTVVPVPSSSTGQSVSPSASNSTPSPSACGQSSAFDISFDDLPLQSVFDNATAGLPPFPSVYRHFEWAAGWSYLPPPNDPYPPHDGQQLAIYVPTDAGARLNNSDTIPIPPGGFGAGHRSSNDAYWFNATSAWVGCDSNATDPLGGNTCEFYAEAYRYDNQTKTNRLHATAPFTQPLCRSQTCQLQQIFFPTDFTQLTTLSFYAKIGASVHVFYVDHIQLSWWDNGCEAQQLRATP